MLEMRTEARAEGISARAVSDFMTGCTDEQYQKWWPGMHVAFHTIKRTPAIIGSLVYFDEFVEKRRLKFKAVIEAYEPSREIVWRMVKIIRLPVRLALYFEDERGGVRITHVLSAGFSGLGKMFDWVFRAVLPPRFEKQLGEHAKTEFAKLGGMLS